MGVGICASANPYEFPKSEKNANMGMVVFQLVPGWLGLKGVTGATAGFERVQCEDPSSCRDGVSKPVFPELGRLPGQSGVGVSECVCERGRERPKVAIPGLILKEEASYFA